MESSQTNEKRMLEAEIARIIPRRRGNFNLNIPFR